MAFHEIVCFKNLYSELNFSLLELRWTIQNPVNLFSTENELLSNNADAKGFQFKIQPSKSNERNAIEIYYLYPISLFLKIRLYRYIDTSEKCQYNKEILNEIDCFKADKPKEWHLLSTISESDIWFHYQLKDGRIMLKIDVKIYRKLIYNRLPIAESQLSLDFENLLQKGSYSDLVIKSVDGQEFNVHKIILLSRSEVIRALFEHDSIESQTNVLESPFVSDILKELLKFIYTDNADVESFPHKLLAAADYYQLIRLKHLCEDVLVSKLSVENVIEILQLADLHSANSLKEEALDFIKNKGLKHIVGTEGWSNFSSAHLIKSICENITCDCQD